MLYFPLWKRIVVWVVVVCGIIIALPNLLPKSLGEKLPQFYSSLHLPMGVDLQGGSRLIVGFKSQQDVNQYRNKTIDVMNRRLALSTQNFSDFIISKQSSSHVRIEAPGLFDVQLLKDLVTTPAHLTLLSEDTTVNANNTNADAKPLPAGTAIVYSMDDPPTGYAVKTKPVINNEDIEAASIEKRINQDNDEETATLKITLTKNGTSKLSQLLKADISQPYVVSFDKEVLALLNLNKENFDGNIRVEGLDVDVAENLAAILTAGDLPTEITIVEERTIGAEMGEDYAKAGLYAAFGALIAVMIFMMLCYTLWGVIADIALAINLLLLIAVLTIIGAPLSLSGFAGIVLIIGISVDSNILIYERIREDRRNGFSIAQSIHSGFSGALGTIIDANMTILIAALVLFFLGVGPIHGFALTVSIGIIISLFTTLVCTRMMIVGWIKRFKPRELPQRFIRFVPINTSIGFMRLRFITLGVSFFLILSTIGLYMTMGVNFGIDFTGGSLAVLQTREGDADIDDVRNRTWALNVDNVTVEPSQNPEIAYVSIASQDLGENAEQAVSRKLDAEFNEDYTLERVDVVGPSVSQRLSNASTVAVIISVLAILVYVWVRFNWKFACGAVLATIHDIIVLFGIFIFFQWQFNIWSIAALLAVIGYSLNDTIVVYDRVRYLLLHESHIPIAKLVDLAINRTLSRTILTSLATLIAHIPLYYFGNPDMRNFASILLLGIIIGTYSSIFIAGPLLVILGVKPPNKKYRPQSTTA